MIAYRLVALFDEFKEKVKREQFEVCHLSFESIKPVGAVVNCIFQRCKVVIKVTVDDDTTVADSDVVEQLKLFVKNNRFLDTDVVVLIFCNQSDTADMLQSMVYDAMDAAFDQNVDLNNTLTVYFTQK